MSKEERPTVWVTYDDKRKDFSKAEQFGELKDVFSSLGRHYNGGHLIEHARHVLGKSLPGDYLLVVGDPVLVGICIVAMLENDEEINVLRWDRELFQYVPLTLNFSWKDA